MLSLGARCLATSVSVKNDTPAVPEKGQKEKSDSDSGGVQEDVFCHAPKSLVPEVTDNEGASFTVFYQALKLY